MRAVLACTKASIHTLHDKESPSEQFADCEGNPQVTQGFPTQRVNGGVFDAFVALIWTSCWIQSRLTGDLQTIMLLWWKTGVKPVESVNNLFVKRRLNGAPLPLVFIMHLEFGRLYTYLCPQILPQNWWLVTYLFNNQSSRWWFEISMKLVWRHFNGLHSRNSVKWTYFNTFHATDLYHFYKIEHIQSLQPTWSLEIRK